LLLIGKTGSGKSSFANYLFNDDRFTTGTGAPVTKWEENFQQYSLNVSDIQVNVYDSVGLEPNNFSRWMQELKRFLSEKQVINQQYTSPKSQGIIVKTIFGKFVLDTHLYDKYSGRQKIDQQGVVSADVIMHILFYVVNGAGARMEDGELKILKDIKDTYKIPVCVIITNCDVEEAENKISAIENITKASGIESVRVCSISRKTRGGDKEEQFGRDLALKQVLSASYEKVGRELAIITCKLYINMGIDLKYNLIKKINESDMSIFNMDNDLNNIIDLDESLKKFEGNDIDLLPSAYTSYYHFVENFNVEYKGRDILEETHKEMSNFLDSFDFDKTKIVKKLNKATKDFEDGNIFEKIGSLATIGGTFLSIKSSFNEIIEEYFDDIQSKQKSLLWKIERS
jgi:hypothetical protein